MKIIIDYTRSEFKGLTRKQIKKICKKEHLEKTKPEWKLKQKQLKEQKKQLKPSVTIPPTDDSPIECVDNNLGLKKLREVVRDRMLTAPPLVIDCSFESQQTDKAI